LAAVGSVRDPARFDRVRPSGALSCLDGVGMPQFL
jgi:hypothetical protein